MVFSVGDNVGAYRITDQVGQGGMATVYKAYHAKLDRYVAIKVLHPAFKEDPSFLDRFTREAQIIARLDHPSIVPVFDYDDLDGTPYLVMKYIEGETLKARLRRGPLELQEAIRIMDSVARALTFAHEAGILHRDIKPSNIMVDAQGNPYLTDFGLARIAQAGESTMSQDMMLGTPQYISPEQAKGIRELKAGTDIYSLGVVLYEIVVGRVPFNADTPYAIVHDHIYKALPMPCEVNPEVPESVQRVLLKALAKEPDARQPSAIALVEEFRAAVQSAGMTELSAARYRPSLRPSEIAEAPTAGTGLPPDIAAAQPVDSTPVYAGIPSPISSSGSASRRARRRRANLWILSGVGALLLTMLASLFVILSAVSQPELQPWNVSSNTGRASAANLDNPPGDAPPGLVRLPLTLTVEEAQRLIDNSPDDPVGYLYMALAEMNTGQRTEAVDTLMYVANNLNPSPDLMLTVARAARQHNEDQIAIWAYLWVIDTEPDPLTRNEAGEYLFALAKIDPLTVRSITSRYQFERHESVMVHTLQAYAVLQLDNEFTLRQAELSLEKAYALNEEMPETLLVSGYYHQLQGEPEAAIEYYDAALNHPEAAPWLVAEAQSRLNELLES